MSTSSEYQRQTSQDPADIERENEQIRADMGETLEALERKLSPGQLLDSALGMLREHSGDAVMKLGQSVKQNPLPLILTTVGVAWLIATYRHSSATARSGADSSTGADSGAGKASGDGQGPGLSAKLQGAKQKIANAKSRVGETVKAAGERLHRSSDAVREGSYETSVGAQRVAQSARLQGQKARDSVERLVNEQPFALAALGLAIGAIIGALLPATAREDQLFGKQRERVLDRVKEAGSRKYEEVRATVKQAGQAAVDSAKAVAQGGQQGESQGEPIRH